ncbi:protein NKG7-like [Tiliqua scincoides]|uniref:protein NKG7-like n=1 Tax=Tiliqua scincoides TaxID=71010 RepID=UPI003462F929
MTQLPLTSPSELPADEGERSSPAARPAPPLPGRAGRLASRLLLCLEAPWAQLSRNVAASSSSLSETFPPHSAAVFMLPLQISCAVCSTATLLLLITSLCTSYWMTETPPQGLLHSGLWEICMNDKCTLYGFSAVATFIHVIRGFLVAATFSGIMSLSCICISIQRTHLGPVPMLRTAATLSFGTVSYRSSKPDLQQLTRYGSSYSLGWASSPMYFLTGFLILLTKGTMDP